jgi:endoglucanase
MLQSNMEFETQLKNLKGKKRERATKLIRTASEVMENPTAPYREQFVQKSILAYCQKNKIPACTDKFGNLYAGIKDLSKLKTKRHLLLVAHMDHPGFHIVGGEGKNLDCFWLGGPPAKGMVGAPVVIWHPLFSDKPLKGKITIWGNVSKTSTTKKKTTKKTKEKAKSDMTGILPGRRFKIKLTSKIDVHTDWSNSGAFGAFDFPGFKLSSGKVSSRHIDDLMGCTMILTALNSIKSKRLPVVGVFTRAEEVGFHGALAGLSTKIMAPKKSVAISIETSKEGKGAKMGEGPVIRLGDRMSIFNPEILDWMRELSKNYKIKNPEFKYQMQVMDGGTCEGTAFNAFGLDAAGISLPLRNYHNSGPKKPAPEQVNFMDALNGVILLENLALNFSEFGKRNPKVVKYLSDRLEISKKELLKTATGPTAFSFNEKF